MLYLGKNNNEWMQLSLALFVDVSIYYLVFRLMFGIQKEVMQIDDFTMLVIILICSLALFPIVFYPLNYLTQTEWSSFDEILKFWPFHLLATGICLLLNYFIITKSRP